MIERRRLLERRRALEATLLLTQFAAFGGSILIARTVGPTGRGILTSLTVWTQVLGWLAAFSLDKAVIVLSRPPKPSFNADDGLRDAARMSAWLTLCVLPITSLFGWLVLHDLPLSIAMLAAVPATAAWELLIGYFLATNDRSAYLRVRMSQPIVYATGVLVVALVLPDARLHAQVVAIALTFVFSMVAPVAWMFIVVRGRMRPRRSPSAIPALFHFAWQAQVGSMLQYVNARLDLLLLPIRVVPAGLGLYAIAVAPVQLIILLGSAGAIRGVTGETHGRDRRALAFVALIALVWVFACPFVIPRVFGASFQGSVPIARILGAGSVAGFASQVASGQLLGRGETRHIVVSQGAAAIIFLLGFLLSHSLEGVAVASVASYVCSWGIAEYFLRRSGTRGTKTLPSREDT